MIEDKVQEPDKMKVKINNINRAFWNWMKSNYTKVLSYEDAPAYMHSASGVLGHNRSKRGAPFYDSSISDAFIRYLDTDEFIRRLSKEMLSLADEDSPVYLYMALRASGYSHLDIDKLSASGEIPRILPRMRSNRGASYPAIKYNYKIINMVTSALPGNIKKSIGVDSIQEHILRNMRKETYKERGEKIEKAKKREQEKRERASAPPIFGRKAAKLLSKALVRQMDNHLMLQEFMGLAKEAMEPGDFQCMLDSARERVAELKADDEEIADCPD